MVHHIRNKADLESVGLNSCGGLDLKGADLREADLWEADFSRADLSRADFREADLSRADFREADLSRADLRGAYFGGADFRGACFTGAHLEWESHFLISVVLIESALEDKEKIAVARFIMGSIDMCWKDFVVEGSLGEFEHLKPWVVSVLDQYDGFIDQVFEAYTGR